MSKESFLGNPELAKERIRFSIESHFEDGTEIPFFSLSPENAKYVVDNNIIESLGYMVLGKPKSVAYGVKFEVGRNN